MKIEMTEEEIMIFKIMVEHKKQIDFIISQDILSIKRGCAIINFDKQGNISSIKKELWCYPIDNREQRE